MKRVGRSVYRTLSWSLLLCLVIVYVLSTAASTGTDRRPSGPREHSFATALAWAFGVWVFFGRPAAYLLVPLFVSTLSCPGCGEEIDAVDVWDCCGCGFRDHQERHILARRCPSCGKAAGKFNCPRCGCTILLW